MELIGRLALGNVKGSKQKKIHCDNYAKSAHVRVGTAGAPVFIFIFSPRAACNQPNLLPPSPNLPREAGFTACSWKLGVPFECFCAGPTMVCFAVQSWLCLSSDKLCTLCLFRWFKPSDRIGYGSPLLFLRHRVTRVRCREVVGCVVTAEMWAPAVLVPSAENCNTASNTAKKFRAWADLLFAHQWHFAVNSISSEIQTSIAPLIREKV